MRFANNISLVGVRLVKGVSVNSYHVDKAGASRYHRAQRVTPLCLRRYCHLLAMRLALSQQDVFVGGYHSAHRRGEVSHGILALVSIICGGGSLSIPWAMAKSGLALGLAILTASATLSGMGVHFLLGGARRAGGLRTFDEVLEAALGPWARALTVWSVVITCFLTLVANSLLLRQLAAPLASQFVLGRPMARSEQVLLGSCLVLAVVPLTFMTTLNSLRHVSLLSVTSVVGLVGVLAYEGLSCPAPPESLTSNQSAVVVTGAPAPPAAADVISALPVFVCIFICSFSALPLDTELRKPSRRRMTTMVVGAFSIAFALYAVRTTPLERGEPPPPSPHPRHGAGRASLGTAQPLCG